MLLLFRSAIGGLAVAVVLLVALIEAGLFVLRRDEGIFAVLQILSPHLALIGVVAALGLPFAGGRAARIAAIALAVVVLARFGGEWLSLPATAPAQSRPVTVVTWNLEVGSRPAADTIALLRAQDADVIALQEITPRVARAIDTDQALSSAFPYRRLVPRESVLGLAVLSRFPITSAVAQLDPAVQRVTLDVDGRPMVVVNVHPMRGRFFGSETDARGIGIGIDVARRNRDLTTIRSFVDDAIGTGASVVLAGDMNTASSEPAFARLVDGLRDAHREVGLGPGWTWRPPDFEWLGVGLIRIDVIVGSPDTRPSAIREACPRIGDHCLVRAVLAIPPS